MEEKLNILKERISKELKDLNILVCSVRYLKENNYWTLKIELDKVNGIDLDTIVEASNIINPIVDEYDFIEESYILDVVSKEKGE